MASRFRTDAERERWIAARRADAADSAYYVAEHRVHDVVTWKGVERYAVEEGN